MSVCRGGEELLSVRGRDLCGLVGNGIRQAPWREEGRGGPVPQAGGGSGTDAGKGLRSEAIRPYPMKKEVTIRS